ncbi:MAG TPA: NmrA/HSCARG family protein [Candidatus Krumholzibacteria bacterium]|nr:NmrA/HSCARG family protein [Candidatus Krumholzibacteria bacterium]
MADKKLIAVVGATGAQGGALARAILNDRNSEFAVRALTRKVESDNAKALQKMGAEVVQADLDDPASVEKAFTGCYGAFCVTNFWEHFSPEKELAQARTMAAAAKRAGLKHVIWSTLEDTRRWMKLDDDRMPTLMGKYKVPHFDAKGEADHFFVESGVPATLLETSFYWENLVYFGAGPQKGPDGKYALAYPLDDKKLPGIAVEDIGKCAYAIFQRPADFAGKTVGISGEHLTGAEMAKSLSKALGQEIAFHAVTPEVYRSFGFPGADDMANMFQFKRDFSKDFRALRDPAVARSLNPELLTFDAWLEKNKDRIPM